MRLRSTGDNGHQTSPQLTQQYQPRLRPKRHGRPGQRHLQPCEATQRGCHHSRRSPQVRRNAPTTGVEADAERGRLEQGRRHGHSAATGDNGPRGVASCTGDVRSQPKRPARPSPAPAPTSRQHQRQRHDRQARQDRAGRQQRRRPRRHSGDNGWYTGDVEVTFTATDACPARHRHHDGDQPRQGDGRNGLGQARHSPTPPATPPPTAPHESYNDRQDHPERPDRLADSRSERGGLEQQRRHGQLRQTVTTVPAASRAAPPTSGAPRLPARSSPAPAPTSWQHQRPHRGDRQAGQDRTRRQQHRRRAGHQGTNGWHKSMST